MLVLVITFKGSLLLSGWKGLSLVGRLVQLAHAHDFYVQGHANAVARHGALYRVAFGSDRIVHHQRGQSSRGALYSILPTVSPPKGARRENAE